MLVIWKKKGAEVRSKNVPVFSLIPNRDKQHEIKEKQDFFSNYYHLRF